MAALKDYEPDDEKLLLSDFLDRLLNEGVAVSGSLTISIADVDLFYCDLKLLLATIEKLQHNFQDTTEKITSSKTTVSK